MAFVKARTGFGRLSSSQALLFEPSGAGFAWTRSGAGSSLDAALCFFPIFQNLSRRVVELKGGVKRGTESEGGPSRQGLALRQLMTPAQRCGRSGRRSDVYTVHVSSPCLTTSGAGRSL